MGRAESPAGTVARAYARSRRRSLLTLGLLAGLTAGLAIASLSGALRTDSALDRLRTAQGGADATVFPSQVGAFQPDWAALAARPEVERIARWSLLFGVIGEGAPEGVPSGPNLLFASVDRTFLGEVGRPIVTEGRMYDPAADDEIVIDENLAELEVGDVLPFQAYAAGQEAFAGEAEGPVTEFRVVGRVRTVNQFLFLSDGQPFVSPGYLAQHADEVIIAENGDVQTVRGEDDIAALETSVNDVLAEGAPVLDLHEAARRVETTTNVEQVALAVLAGLIAAAGLALVGQAVVQSASASVDDLSTLRALGMTRSEVVTLATRAHLLAAATAGAVTAATAVVASIWFPIGMAARVDPDRGVQVTWWLLLPGILLIAGGLLAIVAGTARRDTRARRAVSSLRALSWIRRSTPVPVGLGATLALAPGRGRARVPSRQAIIGAAFGVLGVVAATTLGEGLTDALDHPERAGVAWDAAGLARPGDLTARGIDDGLVQRVADADAVAAAAVVERSLVSVDGIGTPAFSVRPPPGLDESPIDLVVTDGRSPTDTSELAIGPKTAERLQVGIGDTVAVGDVGVERTIVGFALFPSDVHATFDEGVWMSVDGYEEVVPPYEGGEFEYPARSVVVEFDEGVPADDGVAALAPLGEELLDEFGVAEVPTEFQNLDNVRTLPRVLAVFLIGLAVGAVGHTLASSARRRRHDFAVLRALGLGRSGTRVVLNAQGTVIGLVGLAVGVPVGIVLGRLGWGLIAETVPLAVVRPVDVAAVVVLVPVALVLANTLALWPGQLVARLRPAEVLRAE